MIEVKNVVKSFDGFRALDGLTMTVPHGAVYGLVGPNGAGKSTIIRHLAGIYRQDSGDVLVDGQPVYENTAVKSRMAVIGDDWYYFPQSGIREMAKFLAGIYPDFSWERYEKLKQVFPLDEKLMLRRMSKGMQKQAAFWLTVCCMPEYLILDEPVDGLDPVMRRQVWSLLLGDVAERGTTVLVSSHNLRELEDICNGFALLDGGQIADAGYGDLTLAGHVHSMQIKLRLFGRAFSPAQLLYTRWSGRYDEGGRTLYINDGTGYVVFPMRLGAYPEITLITLRRCE